MNSCANLKPEYSADEDDGTRNNDKDEDGPTAELAALSTGSLKPTHNSKSKVDEEKSPRRTAQLVTSVEDDNLSGTDVYVY